MTILISVLIGMFIGFALGFFVCFMTKRNQEHSGVMKIIRDDNKTVYSLELFDDPELLENRNKVIFKVHNYESSNESSDRK